MASLNQLAINKEKKRAKRRRLIFIWGMLALPLLQFFVLYVYANASSIFLSFQTSTGAWTLGNYKMFFNELFHGVEGRGHGYLRAILYSFGLGLNDALLVLVSLILAYFIYKKIPGRHLFRIVFFLPSIVAMTIYIGVFKYLLGANTGFPKVLNWDLGLFDATRNIQYITVPLYCLWVGTGYNILILGGAMANVPTEVIENAKLEGVSRRRELFEIIIPMIWPTLIVSFVGSITVVFTIFMQVDLLTTGGRVSTIASLINHNATNLSTTNMAATMGIVFTVISIPVVLLVKKLLDKLGKKWGYQL